MPKEGFIEYQFLATPSHRFPRKGRIACLTHFFKLLEINKIRSKWYPIMVVQINILDWILYKPFVDCTLTYNKFMDI